MNPLYLNLVIIVFVVYRICNRAYQAQRSGAKTWPILAVLAAVYIVFGALWRFTRIDPTIFWIGSFACLIASQLVYRSSMRPGI